MGRLKTKHEYHDAIVRAVEFGGGDVVAFEIKLCGHCAGSANTVHLSFYGVDNIAEVHSFIDQLLPAQQQDGIAEIIGLTRDEDRRFVVDLDRGPLCISARGFTET